MQADNVRLGRIGRIESEDSAFALSRIEVEYIMYDRCNAYNIFSLDFIKKLCNSSYILIFCMDAIIGYESERRNP